jgi:uncharacterized RDD family membrane protein YckC
VSYTSHSGVVTPEAVVLDLQRAGVGSRTAARFVDGLIKLAALLLLGVASALFGYSIGGDLAWLGYVVVVLALFAVTIGYDVVFEAFWDGRTPGKAAMGLRVVTAFGGPIRFRHACIRGALGLIEVAATSGVIAAVAIAASKRQQRLGDMVAGTIVLRERAAGSSPDAVDFHVIPGTEEFVSTLDVGGIKSDEYLMIRSIVLRSGKMRAEPRRRLAEQLARQAAIELRAMPPAHMGAEIFLLCVLAAYQQRFGSNVGSNKA